MSLQNDMKLGTWHLPKCSLRFLASGRLPSQGGSPPTPTPEHKARQQAPSYCNIRIQGSGDLCYQRPKLAPKCTSPQKAPATHQHAWVVLSPNPTLPSSCVSPVSASYTVLLSPPDGCLSPDIPWLRPPPAPTAAFTFPSPSSRLPSLDPPPRHPSLPFPSPPASTPPLPPVACLHLEPCNAV